MGKVFMHDQTGESSGVKTSNAKLTVNSPSGSIVTVTSGQNRYVAVSDTNDKAVFYGLTHGVWTVAVNDGGQIHEQSIDITTDYEFTLDFFSATINIRYPYGSTCICSNGSTVYTAPDTSGLWTCAIPAPGIWTLEITDGDLVKTETVEITYDGQEASIALEYFTATINVKYPNGAVCSCSNDGNIYSASDTSGSWSFVVHEVGAWVIRVSDGIQTVTQTVSITADGQVKSITIKFFEATITITYPVGAICTCSDGTNTFTAPDTSGKWTVTVPRIGVWSIKATKGSNSDAKTVDITKDGQSASVTCEFFISYINVVYPSGAFKVVLWYIDSYGSKVEKGIDSSASGSCRFTVTQAGSYEIGAYRVAPYVGIENTSGDYASGTAKIDASGKTVSITLSFNTIPEFTYTGTYKITNDSGTVITQSTGNWRIMLLTGGIFRATKLNGARNGIDVFVVGGGGNGGNVLLETYGGSLYSAAGGGGGGGYRETSLGVTITENAGYEIKIAGAGGTSSAFGVSASGGGNGGDGHDVSADYGGGAGGQGGSDGGQGEVNDDNFSRDGEDGVYAFLGTTGLRYGPGGAGGYGHNGGDGQSGHPKKGGKDGGGDSGKSATANSGGGGGGASRDASDTDEAGSGGSGIVIIRNKR